MGDRPVDTPREWFFELGINDALHVGQFTNRISSSSFSKGMKNAKKQSMRVNSWALFYTFDVAALHDLCVPQI